MNMNPWQKLMQTARTRSPWVYCLNTGACNGCDIEIAASLTPRYDAEQLGVRREGSPKHADILVVSGPVTLRTRDALLDIYHQMPSPKAVVAIWLLPGFGQCVRWQPYRVGIGGPVHSSGCLCSWLPHHGLS